MASTIRPATIHDIPHLAYFLLEATGGIYERGMPPAHLRQTDDGTSWEHEDQTDAKRRFPVIQL